jgi:hypothetical protein
MREPVYPIIRVRIAVLYPYKPLFGKAHYSYFWCGLLFFSLLCVNYVNRMANGGLFVLFDRI